MTKTYENLLEGCFPSSWYVQESGERLVQAWLDLLASQSENSAVQQKSATRALAILEELMIHCYTEASSGSFLRRNILIYKAAKLRLFLKPDPHKAIQELETVHHSLSPYYPKTHELIVGLQACLHDATC
jgi:hypothetical protein